MKEFIYERIFYTGQLVKDLYYKAKHDVKFLTYMTPELFGAAICRHNYVLISVSSCLRRFLFVL